MQYPLQSSLQSSARVLAFALLPFAGSAFAAPNAYVANYADNTVSVIDVAKNAVTGTIAVGVAPIGVALTPDGSRAYIANRSASDFEGSVSVIDTQSQTVIATLTVPGAPYGIVASPDGQHVYVTNHHPRKVSVISTQSNLVVANIDVAIKPFQIAITPDGSTVYVSCQDACDYVTAISTASNTVKGYTSVPGGAQSGLDVTPDGSKLYVSSNSETMNVLDATTGALLTTVPVGSSTGAVAVAPDGSTVYAGASNGNLNVISTATNTVTATIPVGSAGNLRGMALTSDGSAAYVADWDAGTVSVIDTGTRAKTATIPVGTNPYSFGKFIQKTPSTFKGFFAPVDNLPSLNTMKAGAAVPIKFSLGADKGLDILAAGFPASRQVACDGAAGAAPVEETVTAGGSSLQYDAASSRYIYVWKTQKEWANTCRQFDLRLKDGSSQKAMFQFAR
jgi:YVTN family beta-propeller protein